MKQSFVLSGGGLSRPGPKQRRVSSPDAIATGRESMKRSGWCEMGRRPPEVRRRATTLILGVGGPTRDSVHTRYML